MTADKRGLIENLRERIADSRGLSDDDREVLLWFSERLDILGKAEVTKILGDMNVDRPTSDRDSADRSDSDSSRSRRDASA